MSILNYCCRCGFIDNTVLGFRFEFKKPLDYIIRFYKFCSFFKSSSTSIELREALADK